MNSKMYCKNFQHKVVINKKNIKEEKDMFFDTWWQAVVFGIVTTTGMLVIANFFQTMWKKYEDKPDKPATQSCDAHHH